MSTKLQDDYIRHLITQAAKNDLKAQAQLTHIYRDPHIGVKVTPSILKDLKRYMKTQELDSSRSHRKPRLEENGKHKFEQMLPSIEKNDSNILNHSDHCKTDSSNVPNGDLLNEHDLFDTLRNSYTHDRKKISPLPKSPTFDKQFKHAGFPHVDALVNHSKSAGKMSHHPHKNGYSLPVASDSTKKSAEPNQKLSTLPHHNVNNHDLSKKNLSRSNTFKHNFSQPLSSKADISMNGFTDKSSVNSIDELSYRGHPQLSHLMASNESSHSKRNSYEPESHRKSSFHEKVPSPAKLVNSASFMREQSPGKSSALSSCTTTPSKKGCPSQKSVLCANLSSRPEHTSVSNDFSNEDRPDDSKNLSIDTSENAGSAKAEHNPKPPSPYSVQLQLGQCKIVKVASEQTTIKVNELKNIGTGWLEDGGFSWGWCIEKRGPGSTSRGKVSPPSAVRDSNRCKRKLDYESSDAPSSKRENYSKDSSNKEHLPKDNSKDPPFKDFGKQELKAVLSSGKEAKNVPSSGIKRDQCKKDYSEEIERRRSLANEKRQQQLHANVCKTISPSVVPSTDGNVKIPKVYSDGKTSKVIDNLTMDLISSKKERTQVYSGRKTSQGIKVGENTPNEVVQPVQQNNSPTKHKVEEHNKHPEKDSDEKFKIYCQKYFRGQVPVGDETWKDVYRREHEKQTKKLKHLSTSISNGISKAPPERQAKLLSVDACDPEKRRKTPKVEVEVPPAKPVQNGRSGSAEKSSGSESSSSCSPQFNSKPHKSKKPTKKSAPLMTKTKKMMKFVNRR